VANVVAIIVSGAVGFIDWLGVTNDAVNSLPGKPVYPVIAAVTGPILTFAPPAFFGT